MTILRKEILLRCFVIISILLGSFTTSYSQKLDSLLGVDVKSLPDTQQIKYYLTLTAQYIPNNKYKKGVAAAKKGLEIAHEINQPLWVAKCRFYVAAHFMRYKPDSCIYLSKLALNEFEKKGHSWSIYCNRNMASAYGHRSMYSEALEVRKEILEFLIEKKDTSGIANELINYGYVFDRMKNYNMAIRQYRKSIAWAQKINDEYIIGSAKGFIGIAKDELKEYDSAHYYNFLAVDCYKKNDDIQSLQDWYSNIANTYIKQKKWGQAEKYMLLSLENLDFENETIKLANLGKIYAATDRYQLAEKTLLQAVENSIKYETPMYLSESYHHLYEMYTEQKKHKKALEYHIKYKEMEDTIASRNRKFQLDAVKLRESTKRQKEELNEADSLIKNKNVLIGLLLLALVLILILTNYLIKKQRQKRREEEIAHLEKMREEKERISRDLHDNIGSQLTFLIAGTDKEQLTELNQFARDTLDQLRNTVWAIKKNRISVADFDIELRNYINKLKNKTTVDIQYRPHVFKDFILSPTAAINLFRVLQEALSNALRHAQAEVIIVSIDSDKGFSLEIEDNGIGIDHDGLKGHGLNFMKQRMEEIKGTFEISNKSKGTSIIVAIPEIAV